MNARYRQGGAEIFDPSIRMLESDGISVIPVLYGFSTLGVESTFNGLSLPVVDLYLVQKSFAKENEENITKERVETISEAMGLETKIFEKAFDSFFY